MKRPDADGVGSSAQLRLLHLRLLRLHRPRQIRVAAAAAAAAATKKSATTTTTAARLSWAAAGGTGEGIIASLNGARRGSLGRRTRGAH